MLARRAETADDYLVSVDLVSRRVRDGQGFDAAFAFDGYRRETRAGRVRGSSDRPAHARRLRRGAEPGAQGGRGAREPGAGATARAARLGGRRGARRSGGAAPGCRATRATRATRSRAPRAPAVDQRDLAVDARAPAARRSAPRLARARRVVPRRGGDRGFTSTTSRPMARTRPTRRSARRRPWGAPRIC